MADRYSISREAGHDGRAVPAAGVPDEGVRAGTTAATLALRPVLQPVEFTAHPTVSAGNASQLSDAA